ncbi:glycine-rich domain-containing protein [Actinomadura adrarensis]|uniref:Glycine-rich domain-containing protein n=1 Tax=Actinomadura adrarensis TaxID=1819600 RepID=A0ABW3CT98_9ACTN
MTMTTDRADPRSMISPGLFGRLTDRIVRDHDLPASMAERTMAQTLAFLATCARNPGAGLAPSGRVDIGWHTFLLYTREYAQFCDRVAGRFIHHLPDEEDDQQDVGAERIGVTVAAMRAAGMPVDTDLWIPTARCSQCYAGCADDPKAADHTSGA